jgi:hypothetical protein
MHLSNGLLIIATIKGLGVWALKSAETTPKMKVEFRDEPKLVIDTGGNINIDKMVLTDQRIFCSTTQGSQPPASVVFLALQTALLITLRSASGRYRFGVDHG